VYKILSWDSGWSDITLAQLSRMAGGKLITAASFNKVTDANQKTANDG
jgi:hypothetical protein